MELWIRSQDKTRLSIITNIQLVEWGGEYSLVGYTNDYVDDFDLGKYKTKERALEVLDDIESLLCGNSMNKKLVKHTGIRSENTKLLIYEMPEN